MDTLLDKDGNEIYNATGYSARLKENGKLGLIGLKPGDMIYVSTYRGSERMVVDYIEGNRIFWDVEGVERCVLLQLSGDTLLFVDRTDS
jgi:hypothetical protein